MITVDGLTVEFGGTTLFKDISFQINEKDRIALMGKNGAGKSTLLKIIAGVRTATRGSVSAPKDCVIAYLPQHLMTEDGRTVFEETCQAFAHLHEMQAEIDRINNELTTRTDYDSDDYMQLIEKVSSLSEKFYAIDMTHFEEDVEKTLLGLGFERSDFNRPTSEFSGGWRMRIELAKLLLKSPDVLLLDEPTNHLDIESIGWLEDFIINSSKAVVVISHDRKFVDDITTRTIEVTMGRIYDYKATYSQYLELRKERREQQMKMEILNMIHSGESPYDIIYRVAQRLEKASGEPGYAAYVKDQLRAVYGFALQEEILLTDELKEVEERLGRIQQAYDSGDFTEEEHIRIGFAIDRHKKNIERLKIMIQKAKADHESLTVPKFGKL